ncbi:MAG: hypothetical protein GY898_02590 [Proteobacteria bacterium]|nr:hypothetical protein [Pseudomonadota bacterium]
MALAGGPALAQTYDLASQQGPIEGLTRTQLDDVVGERRECADVVTFVDGLAKLFGDAAGGGPRGAFDDAFADARNAYGGPEGLCKVVLSGMEPGWPRAVIQAEFNHADRLFEALYGAMEAFADNEPADTINARIQAYEVRLQEWVSWLELSQRFWAGEFLVQRDRSCLVHQAEDAAEVRSLLMQQTVLAQAERDAATLELTAAKLAAAPAAMEACQLTSDVEQVELRLLGETFDAYGEALAALRSGDDRALRRAMEKEQELASRAARCRQEHQTGSVTDGCKP